MGVVWNVVVFHPFSMHSDFRGVLLIASYSKTEGGAKMLDQHNSLQNTSYRWIFTSLLFLFAYFLVLWICSIFTSGSSHCFPYFAYLIQLRSDGPIFVTRVKKFECFSFWVANLFKYRLNKWDKYLVIVEDCTHQTIW